MNSNLPFLADRVIKGRIYPALARHDARPYTQAWREFGEHWPWTTPLRLQEYCNQHDCLLDVQAINSDQPLRGIYPICIGFFDFSIDYIELLPRAVEQAVRERHVTLLFYYHEGDNPFHIKSRLDYLCQTHNIDTDCYIFVSANSRARTLEQFVWFADFELWYYQRNLAQPATPAHTNVRPRDFTALNRIHKSWRACVMADLLRQGVLENSIWSYCNVDNVGDDANPIEIDRVPQLRWTTEKFLAGAPYYADGLTDQERNDHSVTVTQHHADAYANIVLESQFDVDQSGGSFLTEKTFKAIKHGQLFFIAGGPGSLQQLRDLGYRTFDSVLDNSYDLEPDPTERWLALRDAIMQARAQGLHDIYCRSRSDIEHNQKLFLSSKQSRLNSLLETIYEHCR